MIFIEPTEVYACRTARGPVTSIPKISAANSATQSRDVNAPLRFADGWDEHILAYVSAQAAPVRIVSLSSQLRKCVRHRDKQHKEKLKRDILLRVGALIRVGSLIRVQRNYVTVRQAHSGR
nr:hypothetical protein [Nitrosomonas nitrosa]